MAKDVRPTVLAFNDPYHDSSFCISDENGFVHVEMERITRQKFETENPILGFCDLFPEMADRFDVLAVEESDHLAPLIRRIVQSGSGAPLDAASLARLVEGATAPLLRERSADAPRRVPDLDAIRKFCQHLRTSGPRIYFCGHHEAHAANAFFSSGYPSALTLTLDGGGYDYVPAEGAGRRRVEVFGGVYDCSGTAIRRLATVEGSSIALAWVRVTRLLGLPWGEEGTVMAMAALGDPARFAQEMDQPFLSAPHGEWLVPSTAEVLGRSTEAFRARIRTEQDRHDLAASLQLATERRVERHIRTFLGEGVRHLCLAGGLFLNCQILGKIRSWFPQLRGIFIPPAPYDGGISLGAAQAVLHQELGIPAGSGMPGIAPFAMGKSYSTADVVSACRRYDVLPRRAGDDDVVRLLESGGICGLFGGPAESGRRALGHRSLVADPRRPDMKDRINRTIKHRQWFRPLAPMILAEHVCDWFECDETFASPYMSFAIPIRPTRRDAVPGIVHLDGTSRVQTVHRELSPRTHELLSKWHEHTGVPLLINTSFNDREPIVESPDDALATYSRIPVDAVYFFDCGLLVSKTTGEPS